MRTKVQLTDPYCGRSGFGTSSSGYESLFAFDDDANFGADER